MKSTLIAIAFAVATFAAQQPAAGTAKTAPASKPAVTSKSATSVKKHHRKTVKKGATTAAVKPAPAAKK